MEDSDVGSEGAVFISYSRTEAPLVEDLVRAFDRGGVPTFVDFRNLEAGGSWDQQVDQAVDDSSLMLFVVSERSVWGSDHTRGEWQRALAQGKRIILAIVESVALPADLVDREWIDLRRGRFRRRVHDLARLIANPCAPERRPPTSGLGAPRIVWLGTVLATMAALLSLPLIWTIALPLVLAPLPWRILRRSFDYRTVRLALAAEAVIVFVFFGGNNPSTLFLIPLAAFAVLRSRSFRRWMVPLAARPKLQRLPRLDRTQCSGPQRYCLDYAEADRRYVRQVDSLLKRYGHIKVDCPSTSDIEAGPDGISRPDVALRFVSRYYDIVDTDFGVPVLPILISTPDDELPVHLQRTQWLDFRPVGPHRRKLMLEHLAMSIERPADLLRQLGIMPPYGTRPLPRAIQALHDLIWACISVVAVSVIVEMAKSPGSVAALITDAGSFVALFALALPLLRALTRREPRRFELYLLVIAGLLVVVTFNALEWAGNASSGTEFTVTAGLMVMAFFCLPLGWLLTALETTRWIPSSGDAGMGRFQLSQEMASALPACRNAIVAAVNDLLGRELRADLRRRASRTDSHVQGESVLPASGSRPVIL
jgi:TIR domain